MGDRFVSRFSESDIASFDLEANGIEIMRRETLGERIANYLIDLLLMPLDSLGDVYDSRINEGLYDECGSMGGGRKRDSSHALSGRRYSNVCPVNPAIYDEDGGRD